MPISLGFESSDVFSDRNTLSTLICWMYRNDVSTFFLGSLLLNNTQSCRCIALDGTASQDAKVERADFTPQVSDAHFDTPIQFTLR